MYVIVVLDEIHGFGRTKKQARADVDRRLPLDNYWSFDYPLGEVYRCSAELYRQLEARPRSGAILIPFRIARNGFAVPATEATRHRGSPLQRAQAEALFEYDPIPFAMPRVKGKRYAKPKRR